MMSYEEQRIKNSKRTGEQRMSVLNKKIGIIGGGQLGKMMILEAKRLGFYVVILDPILNCPSHSISDEHIVADFDDKNAIRELAGMVDVITYEFEHINVEALQTLENEGHVVYPSVASLKVIQDKYSQKMLLKENDIPVPAFEKVQTIEDIYAVGSKFNYPMMLKTTKGGYDGKGNSLIAAKDDVERAYAELGSGSKELMVESFIPFQKEISIIACRTIDGQRQIYPVAENIHKHSILDTTIVPARISKENTEFAQKVADNVMKVFDGVGTFCIEMFVVDGEIYVNEVAPRPHNSGHYTIEGTRCNQFENHIRAVTGLALGNVSLTSPIAMRNMLGEESSGIATVVGLEEAYAMNPNLKVHIYGKENSQVGRKMGHLTVTNDDIEIAIEQAEQAKQIVKFVGATVN